jgi:hypothetical protein
MSYTNNPKSILAGTGIIVTPSTGNGANTITISAGGVVITAIRIALTTPVAVLSADAAISVQVPGPVPVAVNLPAGVTGQTFIIKDGLGLASVATPITIVPTAGTIDGAVNATITAPYGSLTLIYDGVQWLLT